MSSTFAPAAAVIASPGPVEARIIRWHHLALVLWVGISMPIFASVCYLLGGTASAASTYGSLQLWGALITEASGLLVLWYVMRNQGKTWTDIGWSPSFRDIGRAFGLLLATTVASWVVYIPVQYVYRAYSHEFLTQKSMNSTLAFGISGLSILFVCVNPFFEELIVRAYTISELTDLGVNRILAIAISVVVQLSYHLYQGLANVLVLMVVFSVLSIYYTRDSQDCSYRSGASRP